MLLPPSCREKRGRRGRTWKSLSENGSRRTDRHVAKTRERETVGRSKVPKAVFTEHSGLSISPKENSFHSPNRPNPTRGEVSKTQIIGITINDDGKNEKNKYKIPISSDRQTDLTENQPKNVVGADIGVY